MPVRRPNDNNLADDQWRVLEPVVSLVVCNLCRT